MKDKTKIEKKPVVYKSKLKRKDYDRYLDASIRSGVLKANLIPITKNFMSEYLRHKTTEKACRGTRYSNIITDGISFSEYLYLKDTFPTFAATFYKYKKEMTENVIDDGSSSNTDPYFSLKATTSKKQLEILSKGKIPGDKVVIQINPLAEIRNSVGTKKTLIEIEQS